MAGKSGQLSCGIAVVDANELSERVGMIFARKRFRVGY
jgi:hypothetical protein